MKLSERNLSVRDLDALLITHIHLDHAGASGELAQEHPSLRVYVHEKGATHLIDPEKLLKSAARLYGDTMDALWGRFLPVPRENINSLVGGETLDFGHHAFDVAHTPGHASHHVCYFQRTVRRAFTGDTAGVRIARHPYIAPPTLPPDVDLDAWSQSISLLRAWNPEQLLPTHFGPIGDVEPHLGQLETQLANWASRVKTSLELADPDVMLARAFLEEIDSELQAAVDDVTRLAYLQAAPPEMCWIGLARYWRKRNEA